MPTPGGALKTHVFAGLGRKLKKIAGRFVANDMSDLRQTPHNPGWIKKCRDKEHFERRPIESMLPACWIRRRITP
jgi:hypothetical protein